MTNMTFDTADKITALGHAGSATAAMARQLRSHPVVVKDQTLAALARLLALRRLGVRPGFVKLPPVLKRSAIALSEQGSIGSYPDRVPARPADRQVVRSSKLAGTARGSRSRPALLPSRIIPGARAAIATVEAGETGVASLTRVRAQLGHRALTAPRLSSHSNRGTTLRSAGANYAPISLAGQHLLASTRGVGEASRRITSIAAQGAPASVRQRIGPPPQQPSALGFHRTVRQPQARAAAGHVYLDKTLVGHHLAAVITAEQTRAASRPDISGARFNSSMAAFRPSGGGL